MTQDVSIKHLQHEISARTLPINVRQAMADGIISVAARAKDWPLLHDAIDAKISDQRDCVASWDATISPRQSAGRGHKTVSDLLPFSGVTKMQVSRWRNSLKDEDAYHLKIYIRACKAAGIEPDNNHRGLGTGQDEWYTPPEYVLLARSVMGDIDLDPASHPTPQEWIKAKTYFTAEDNALNHMWHGRVWLNPPYSRELIGAFITKLLAELEAKRVSEAILLTHNYTETSWFQTAADKAALICFPRGRIKFIDINRAESNPTQGQAFFYYGPRVEEFNFVFGDYGLIAAPTAPPAGVERYPIDITS